ncbi:MAG: tetratricopeptide repeat protein, partial [Bacteroidetes bacterium]|nr:tetratricopeptide repeat protein [Bacteroidota bacterium]
LTYHNLAYNIFEKNGDKENVAKVLCYIGQDYADGGNYPQALVYFEKALKLYKAIGDEERIGSLYLLFGWVYVQQGNYYQSSKINEEAIKTFEKLGDSYSLAFATSNIGDDMYNLGNYAEAIAYYKKGLFEFEKKHDKINTCDTYYDLGNCMLQLKDYAAAIKFQLKSLEIASQTGYTFGSAMANFGIGNLYEKQGDYIEALNNYLLAIQQFKQISNKVELASLYSQTAGCYVNLNQLDKAKEYFQYAFDLAKQIDSKRPMRDYYQRVEKLDSITGNWHQAYLSHKEFNRLNNSILDFEIASKLTASQLKYEEEKSNLIEKTEQDKKDLQQRIVRNAIGVGLLGALVFSIVVYRQRNKISKARKRSDELLLNILPEEVAEELKAKGSADAKQFDDVTVMFTDFKGFTQISEKLSPTELVNEIHDCFKAFDEIISKHNIEKIKTIGDSYMCAGGLPVMNRTNAMDVVSAAVEINNFMQQHSIVRKSEGKEVFEIRIGIHTGPVVAGIVGVKKFAYDIWGDTVNIASRMESSSEAGKVNISGSTYNLVKEKYNCLYRGKIEAKNKGEIDMYFVEAKT